MPCTSRGWIGPVTASDTNRSAPHRESVASRDNPLKNIRRLLRYTTTPASIGGMEPTATAGAVCPRRSVVSRLVAFLGGLVICGRRSRNLLQSIEEWLGL